MYRTIAALLAVMALAGCRKHDAKAEQDREQVLMMQKLLEAAAERELDAGPGPATAQESHDAH
jgi:uncharacterized protein YcfL